MVVNVAEKSGRVSNFAQKPPSERARLSRRYRCADTRTKHGTIAKAWHFAVGRRARNGTQSALQADKIRDGLFVTVLRCPRHVRLSPKNTVALLRRERRLVPPPANGVVVFDVDQ
jgi:hypothetical protein